MQYIYVVDIVSIAYGTRVNSLWIKKEPEMQDRIPGSSGESVIALLRYRLAFFTNALYIRLVPFPSSSSPTISWPVV